MLFFESLNIQSLILIILFSLYENSFLELHQQSQHQYKN